MAIRKREMAARAYGRMQRFRWIIGRARRAEALQRELAAALAGATKSLIAERDCSYESVSGRDGEVPDPDDRRELIDKCLALLERAGQPTYTVRIRAVHRALLERAGQPLYDDLGVVKVLRETSKGGENGKQTRNRL